MLGSFWDHVGSYFGIILGSFWGHSGTILGSCWNHFGIMLGSFLNPAGCSVDPTMSKPCVAGAGTTLPRTMLPRPSQPRAVAIPPHPTPHPPLGAGLRGGASGRGFQARPWGGASGRVVWARFSLIVTSDCCVLGTKTSKPNPKTSKPNPGGHNAAPLVTAALRGEASGRLI